MISLFIIYITIVIFSVIWIKFGESLESVQYYHHKLISLEWNNYVPSFEDMDYSNKESLTLLRCCVLSGIIYSKKDNYIPKSLLLPFFQKIYKLIGLSYTRKLQTVGYVAKCKDYLIISLVSTANLNDVLVSTDNKLTDIIEGQIHKGYYIHTLELIPSILKILSLYPNIKKLYITGHSMGGALSSIVGYFINKNFSDYFIKVYTYASPKYGNKQLKYYLEKRKNIVFFNTINESDMVIYKPLHWKYTRIGKEINHKIDTGNDNVNHGIKVYRECVLKKEKSEIPKRPHRMDEIISRWFLDILG